MHSGSCNLISDCDYFDRCCDCDAGGNISWYDVCWGLHQTGMLLVSGEYDLRAGASL